MTGISSSCGACKFLRRKCTSDCVFAPYYSYGQAAHHFAAVHRVFGASNASRLLLQLPEHYRYEAAAAISFEALTRMQDPVYGCVGCIYALQQQVANLQEEIEILNLAIGIAGCGSPQAPNNLNDGLLLTTRAAVMSTQEYINEQQQLARYTGNTTNHMINSQMLPLPLPQPPSEWEGQFHLSVSDPSPLDILLEEVSQGISSCAPWIDSGDTHEATQVHQHSFLFHSLLTPSLEN
ncbi:hypothetical protein Ancab_005846 [Ancistrocladus abbreviatus]